MRRPFTLLAVMLLAGAAAFFGGQRLVAYWCAKHMARPTDDLDWLRLEFRLNAAELARVRQLHDGYLPKCREYCERIDALKQELEVLLASSTNTPAAIEQKLVEVGTARAQCQAAMLEHFREVSLVMPPDQGRRYLAEMQRLTLGFHEQIERTMSPAASSPHGHR
ncbi:MAG: periplasmic heavy metal sensor [Verrucomicrobia bacterium]|jgi:hypothetical protein|nr:periplasmic heavy metal sensor [Verrucomicrobiota bacterium]MDI9381451.1 periplasmic heavy metal sensor [Verrucomicrobiota bacterium]NMD19650.1 periplasmic heavy metal sensor [Verrucomicrobiota bacterium]HOA61575.1 periplasmic heavy metal sensor [Verrucomicrobiota bacterium]HOF49152.1 periplasmic heavy metal sensor [Verrucomicrobiota bacterium]